jgi:DNA-binding response OmpR family regulator
MKVLLVEDDQLIRDGLAQILTREGYEVLPAEDGATAMQLFQASSPDFICLDVMMPKLSGYEVCKRIRAARPQVPIIFISAKSEEIDRVLGLELGADDYIVKPFGVKEVVARIRAITRRCLAATQTPTAQRSFRMDDLDVYPQELRAKRGSAVMELSLRDINILHLLFTNRGRAMSRDAIFQHCWGNRYLPSSRTLDQHISQLRKRVEQSPRDPRIIRTVHGVGYRFDG